MEPELLELLDKQAITETLYQYCRGIDRNDREAAVAVWHPDGIADYGPGVYTGTGEGFVDWVWESSVRNAHELYQHRITNILIEVRGDRAVSESYFVAHIRGRDEQGALYLSNHYGRYADSWSRRHGVWGIDKRTQLFDFFTADAPEATIPGHRGTRDGTDKSHAVLGSLGNHTPKDVPQHGRES